MMLEGAQRGGAKQAADHYTNTQDNEHVEVHDIRGFVAQSVHGALLESCAISKGTRSTQHMFSVSLNPPPGEGVSVEDFEDALGRIERKLGLERQPRVVVFHEKEGRRHAHAVYCRIDRQSMTAINLPFYKMKLQDVTRELFIEHQWKMPSGLINSKERDPNNFNLAEWQQAIRAKQSPQELNSLFRECWAASDSRSAFEYALKERGFLLARGNRRNFVAVDFRGEIYSLSRKTGIKTRDLEERLGSPEKLPSIEERQAYFAGLMNEAVRAHVEDNGERRAKNERELEEKRLSLVAKQRRERQKLVERQDRRLMQERCERQQNIARGLRGLWDRISGRHARVTEENERADKLSVLRNVQEREALIRRQLQERGRLQIFVNRVRARRSDGMRINLNISPEEIQKQSRTAKRVRRDPEHLLSLLTDKESTFTRDDIAKALGTYIDDPRERRRSFLKVMASGSLVELQSENRQTDSATHYSTREIVTLEQALLRDAASLAECSGYAASRRNVDTAIKRWDSHLQATDGAKLSTEQHDAIRHVTGNQQLACVVGVAGAGKSTMLAAAKQAWEQSGYRVLGAALAGKAAKGLEQSSGIRSKTLASYESSWSNGLNQLQKNDILVIDEAGMIGSRQMARFVSEAKDKGAKIVLVGDAEQLQPICAGSPFRALAREIDPASLQSVHRQKQDWQRQASMALATGQTKKALQAYQDRGAIEFTDTTIDARSALVRDYLEDMVLNGETVSRLALAHRRVDVREINEDIRRLRKVCGDLEGERTYKTSHGKRAFASGDRLLFTRNDRELGVKNGMLASVVDASRQCLTVRLDSDSGGEKPETLTIPINDYDAIDHGYATTIHKSQGATVERSFILASTTLDRHLTYVAMTRHKNEATLYAGRDEFRNINRLTSLVSRARQKRSTLDFGPEIEAPDRLQNELNHQRCGPSREYS